jgi:hypothetical protein
VADATCEDITALIQRFDVPMERGTVPDWPGFARALAYEARRHRLPMPHWLAMFGGYPEPPVPLRVLPGGAAGSEDTTTPAHRSRIVPRSGKGGGVIIVGTGTANLIGKWKAHLDAQAKKTQAKTAPTDPSDDSSE